MEGIKTWLGQRFSRDRRTLRLVRMSYHGGKKTKLEDRRLYFDMKITGEYTMDDQTWEDLNMDKVYQGIDSTYSSPGEAVLYHMLRNPLLSEEALNARSGVIDFLQEHRNLRERLQCAFLRLGRNHENSLLLMISEELAESKLKFWMYTFIGKLGPLTSILLSLFVDSKFLLMLLAFSMANISISMKEAKEVKSSGVSYLRDLIKAARRAASTKEGALADHAARIGGILNEITAIEKGTRFIGFERMFGGIFEPVSSALLLEQCSYYRISDRINLNRQNIMDLYGLIGELDVLCSIAEYKERNGDILAVPRFTEQVGIRIVDGVHPLLKDAVPNSADINGRDIILTGTNMSGKSTFLRTLGVNMILAQTFRFVHAKEYEACFFNVVTSISPNDDVMEGKSFFMAEVESMKRVLTALEKPEPVFCPIDELFRGTNPIERIAMSAEILLHIHRLNSVCIATTHDRELVDILKDSFQFFYFSERVDSESGLSFDYKLKEGVSKTRNAIKLLEYCKYPESITESAFKRAQSIEGFI